MAMSGLWNLVLGGFFFLGLIWVCVGIFWLVPALLALVYLGLGIGLAVVGNKFRLAAFLPILGFAISRMNFNFVGLMLDGVALALGVIGFVQNRRDD